MKRRNFIQLMLGAIGISAVKLPEKAKAELNGIDKDKSWIPLKSGHVCRCYGYEITSIGNKLSWVPIESFWVRDQRFNGIELAVQDVCRGIFNIDGHIRWYGFISTWEIQFIGGEQVFLFIRIK